MTDAHQGKQPTLLTFAIGIWSAWQAVFDDARILDLWVTGAVAGSGLNLLEGWGQVWWCSKSGWMLSTRNFVFQRSQQDIALDGHFFNVPAPVSVI